MASFNRVVLLGNLTRDVECKYLQSGTAVADLGLAVNERRKGQGGEWIDETTFVDCTVFGRTAEFAGEYLGKGSQVLIEGRLKLETWETEGQRRSKLKVIVEKLQSTGSRSERKLQDEEQQPASRQPARSGRGAYPQGSVNSFDTSVEDSRTAVAAPVDDIPF